MTGSNILQDNPWPDEAVKMLVSLWTTGHTAGQIGKIMSKTRNAIIGKVHRLGLTREGDDRPRIVRRTTKATISRRSGFNPSIPRRTRPLLQKENIEVVTLPPLNGDGVTLLDLKQEQCHAVIFTPSRCSSALPRYCGNPAHNSTAYCEGHFHEYHRPNLKAG